jgi:DNA-binding NarL/FixJ family response regulator
MNILIADYHQLFCAGLRLLLDHFPEDTVFDEVRTFGGLVEQCRSGRHYDLVLMDLRMPGWSGFGDIRQVLELQPGTPLVVISASQESADIWQALEQGARGFIPKSSTSVILKGALDLVLSGGVYVPPVALQSGAAPAEAHPEGEEDHCGFKDLTSRQCEVLAALRTGKSNKQIAYDLRLSEGTVKIHVTAILRSLGVSNRTEAVIAAAAKTSQQ